MPFLAALPAISAGAGLLGRIFGGASQGSANNRRAENQQALQNAQINNANMIQRGQLQSQDALNRAGLDLQRRTFQQNEPNVQARQAAIGSLLQRIQPLSMSGLSPRVQGRMPRMNSIIDALGPEAREAGGLLASRGLSGLQSGGTQFDPVPALNLPPAMVAAIQQPGMLEKILGWGGLIGSTVGALGDFGDSGGRGPQPHDGDADPRYPW